MYLSFLSSNSGNQICKVILKRSISTLKSNLKYCMLITFNRHAKLANIWSFPWMCRFYMPVNNISKMYCPLPKRGREKVVQSTSLPYQLLLTQHTQPRSVSTPCKHSAHSYYRNIFQKQKNIPKC